MNKSKIKVGIYGIALLMMGVIGISGALAVIGANFPDASQTMIQNMISIPCLVVIPVTLVVGKMMDVMSKKNIAIIGILAFLVGGVGPAFVTSLPVILVLRGVLGVGVGIVQPVASALVAENFEGPERDKVQGNVTSAQMLGCAVMVFAGGWLANMSWEKVFYVHLLAVIALVVVLACLPNVKPEKHDAKTSDAPTDSSTTIELEGVSESAQKGGLNVQSWIWALTMFLLFVAGQVYSVYLSYIVDEKALGTSAQSGNAMAFFAIGGFLIGLVFGKLSEKARNLTLTIGMVGMVIAYLVIAFASSMISIYLGAFLFGVSLSICMPCIIVGTAGSVSLAASGMAISITMCGQNLGQFVCPYIFNPLTASMAADGNTNQMAFLLGAAMIAVMAVIALIWGIKENRKDA
jgi:MFS family permease